MHTHKMHNTILVWFCNAFWD